MNSEDVFERIAFLLATRHEQGMDMGNGIQLVAQGAEVTNICGYSRFEPKALGHIIGVEKEAKDE